MKRSRGSGYATLVRCETPSLAHGGSRAPVALSGWLQVILRRPRRGLLAHMVWHDGAMTARKAALCGRLPGRAAGADQCSAQLARTR